MNISYLVSKMSSFQNDRMIFIKLVIVFYFTFYYYFVKFEVVSFSKRFSIIKCIRNMFKFKISNWGSEIITEQNLDLLHTHKFQRAGWFS